MTIKDKLKERLLDRIEVARILAGDHKRIMDAVNETALLATLVDEKATELSELTGRAKSDIWTTMATVEESRDMILSFREYIIQDTTLIINMLEVFFQFDPELWGQAMVIVNPDTRQVALQGLDQEHLNAWIHALKSEKNRRSQSSRSAGQ